MYIYWPNTHPNTYGLGPHFLFLTKLFAVLTLYCSSVVVHGDRNSAGQTLPSNKLVNLHEDNWHLMLQGEWMVEFFAPWCPACKNLAPTWEQFSNAAYKLNVKVAVIDVTTSPSLSGRFFVTALPTVYHVSNGEFRHYRGSRDADSLYNFLKHEQWKSVTPISSWKKPDTIHMSILSYFFKLSHALKDLNMYLQEEYGLPTWATYTLFAFATIFVGATLGLLLVFLVDSLYPPKKLARQSFVETKERDNREGVEDLDHDELEDDNENTQHEFDQLNEGETTNEDEDEEEVGENEQEQEIVNTKNKDRNQVHAAASENIIMKSKTSALKETEDVGDKSQNTNTQAAEMRKRNKPRKAD